MFIFIVGILINNSMIAATGSSYEKIDCYEDVLFDLTKPLNRYFNENDNFRHTLMVISSLFIDTFLIVFLIRWTMFSETLSELFFPFFFYGTRGTLQAIFIFGMPEGLIWDYPGLPSLTITYMRTSDFFYSGHVGVILFCTI